MTRAIWPETTRLPDMPSMSVAVEQDSSLELTHVGSSPSPAETAEEHHRNEAAPLAPVDGGIKAWTFVFSSFVLECLVWGFAFSYGFYVNQLLVPSDAVPSPASFGIFQEWYLTHPPFDTASETSINAIGTITIAIQYMEGLIVIAISQRRPQLLPKLMWFALAGCSGSMFLSSFSTSVGVYSLTSSLSMN